MKQILVVKPDTLSQQDKQRLQENDIILIEHPNPEEVRVITSLEGIEGNDVLDALAEATKKAGWNVSADFTKFFLDKVLARKKT